MTDTVDRKTFIDFAALAIITTQSAGIDAAEAYEEAGKVWEARQAYFNVGSNGDVPSHVSGGDYINALININAALQRSHPSSIRRTLEEIERIVSEVLL